MPYVPTRLVDGMFFHTRVGRVTYQWASYRQPCTPKAHRVVFPSMTSSSLVWYYARHFLFACLKFLPNLLSGDAKAY